VTISVDASTLSAGTVSLVVHVRRCGHTDRKQRIDTASYERSTAGVTVSLEAAPDRAATPKATPCRASRPDGSAFGDTLIGDAGNNVLIGGDGK